VIHNDTRSIKYQVVVKFVLLQVCLKSVSIEGHYVKTCTRVFMNRESEKLNAHQNEINTCVTCINILCLKSTL
jgi:hypothetical protein